MTPAETADKITALSNALTRHLRDQDHRIEDLQASNRYYINENSKLREELGKERARPYPAAQYLGQQIAHLASYFQTELPGEIKNGGAVENAIRVMREQQASIVYLEKRLGEVKRDRNRVVLESCDKEKELRGQLDEQRKRIADLLKALLETRGSVACAQICLETAQNVKVTFPPPDKPAPPPSCVASENGECDVRNKP